MTPACQPSPGYPSPSGRCSSRHRFTYRCTDEYEPANPCSSTSLSYTRLAVCRCLRGRSLSAASHESTTASCASTRLRLPPPAPGLGEQSSIVAYFLTVSRDTSSRLAISRHDTP